MPFDRMVSGYVVSSSKSPHLLMLFTLDTWSQLVLDDSFDPSSKEAQVRTILKRILSSS